MDSKSGSNEQKSKNEPKPEEILQNQFNMIVSTRVDKDKQQSWIKTFSQSLDKYSNDLTPVSFGHTFKRFLKSINGINTVINESNIDIIKILCKHNNNLEKTLPDKYKVGECTFNYTRVLKHALQESKETFNENIIKLFMQNGATLDEDDNMSYLPSAHFIIVLTMIVINLIH